MADSEFAKMLFDDQHKGKRVAENIAHGSNSPLRHLFHNRAKNYSFITTFTVAPPADFGR